MSREIDERVVQMKFENGQFEHNVQTSIHSLDELKKGLDFKDASKGLEKIDKASKEINFNPLAASVELLSSKFNLLGITAFNVMNRISNKAIDTGEALVKSLSTDQIAAGWGKFSEKTSSVQTIMAATAKQFAETGGQMEYVNAQLDKLNWFTDETSYNFLDMVSNIGKFTSNNIQLDTAVTAMQGVANWAAISGANANEASRAMYNLSQAISTGSLKLMDWMSIENANMATAQFKETAIEAAVSAGTLKKGVDGLARTMKGNVVSVENFRENLSEAWLTADVLLNTLDLYGGATNKLNQLYEDTDRMTSLLLDDIDSYLEGTRTAEEISKDWGKSLEETTAILEEFGTETMQFGIKAFRAAQEAKTFQDAIDSVKDAVSTGWMNTFQYIFGDYEEAKEFWTWLANALYDIFAIGSEARNEMFADWNEAGGRETFIATLQGALGSLMILMGAFRQAWNEIMGTMDSEKLLKITDALAEFTLVIGEGLVKNSDKITRSLKGLFSILDILRTLVSGAVKTVFEAFGVILGETNIDILEFTARIGDALVAFRNWVKTETWLTDASRSFIGILKQIVANIKNFGNSIKDLKGVDAIIKAFNKSFTEDFKGVGSIITALGKTFAWFLEKIRTMKMPKTFEEVKQFFVELKTVAMANLEGIGISFDGLQELVKGAGQAIRDVLGYLADKFSEASIICANALRFIAEEASKVDWSGIILVGGGIGVLFIMWKLTGALGDLAESLGRVTGVFKEAKGAFTAIKDYFNALKKSVNSKVILTYAISIGILAASLVALAQVDVLKLVKGGIAIGALAIALGALTWAVNKFGADAPMMSALFLSFAASVGILTLAFNSIKVEGWVGRLALLGTLMGSIVAVSVLLNKFAPQLAITAGSLMGMAASVLILAKAFDMIGKMNADNIFKALPIVAAIGLFMSAMIALQQLIGLIPNERKLDTSFFSFISIALSIRILAGAIEKIGKMDQDVLMQGLSIANVLIAELGAIMLASRIAGKNAAKAGVMILAISVALMLMKGAIKNLSKLSVDEVTKGLLIIGALSLVFGALVTFSKNAGKHAAKAGIMLLAVAGALAILQLVVKTLGRIDLQTLAKGTGAVSILMLSMAPILAFSKNAKNATGSIIALTGVIAVIGIMVAALAGLANWLGGDKLLVAATSISEVLLAISLSLKLLEKYQPESILKISLSALAMSGVITILGLILAGLSVIANPDTVLPVALSMSVLLLALSASLKIISSLNETGLLKKTAEAAKSMLVVLGVIGIVFAALGGLAYLLGTIDKNANGSLSETISSSVQMMKDLGEAIGGFLGSVVGGAVGGFGESMFAVLPAIGDSLTGFMTNAQGFFDGLSKIPGGLFAVAGDLIGMLLLLTGTEFIEGIKQLPVIGAIFEKGAENLPDQFKILGECCKAFADALDGGDYTNVEAAANAGRMLAELEYNLPGTTANIDGTIPDEQGLEAFATRLTKFGEAITSFAETVKDLDVDSVNTAASAGETLAALEASLQPVGGTVQEWFFGEKDLAAFGNRLWQFGLWIRLFAGTVKDLDTDSIETARVAGSTLAELEKSLPAKGGVLNTFIFGNKNLGDFGKRLKQFGDAIVKFSNTVADIKPLNIRNAAIAARDLGEVEKELSTQGGAKGFWFGDNSLGTFGDNLKKFGRGLADFSGSLVNVDFTLIHNAIDYITDLISVSNLVNASEIMASAATDLMNDVINVILANESKFRKNGEDIAKWVAEGFKKGASKYTPVVTAAAKALAESIDKTMRKTLEISSPSAVMEEVGMWTVKGLAEGIKNDMSAEEAAEKKASNIVSAFQTVLSRLSTKGETANLEYQLWELTEGATADQATKDARMMALKEDELKMEAEKVRAHNAKLETLRKTLGEDSDKYKEAYNDYLSAQISMVKKAQEIDELQQTTVTDERTQMRAYAETMKEYAASFEMLGKSREELEAFAREKSGYGVEQLQKDLIDTKAIMASALADQSVTIEQTVADTTAKSVSKGLKSGLSQAAADTAPVAEDNGKNLMDGLGEGVEKAKSAFADRLKAVFEYGDELFCEAAGIHSPSEEMAVRGDQLVQGLSVGIERTTPTAVETTQTLATLTLDEFRKRIPQYEYIARMCMEGFITGIVVKGKEAIAAAQEIAQAVADIMCDVLDINSPSKVMMDIGGWVGEGLAIGMQNTSSMIEESSKNMANNALSGLESIRSQVADILANDDDYSPTITPVLDLDVVKQQAGSIPGMLGSGISVRASLNRANSIASIRNSVGQNGSQKDAVAQTNYNFTQNNYSPKALNRVEIYRQTKNQFSQLKGATNR